MSRSRKVIVFRIALLILAAVLCRNIGREIPGCSLGIVRSLLYLGLFAAWGISLRRRVMQPQTRHFLTSIAGLIVFWLLDRTVKYFFVTTAAATRYLWYGFYLPLLFIPLFAVLVAASLDKPEDYRLPRWTRLLYFLTGGLFLLVLTNDLHQTVFSFDSDLTEWWDSGYTYGAGYYAVMGFVVLCALIALAMMIRKCRSSRGRKIIWVPLLFVPPGIVYAVLYAIYIEDHGSLLYYIAGDMTVTNCLLFAGLLESCLQAGLIPTNTGYDALFRVSSVGMRITDTDYNICYASDTALPVSVEEMRGTEDGERLLNGTTLLRSHVIHGGYIVWEEDVSELLRVKDELEAIREELQERNDVLRDQYRQDARRYRLEEQNRLYDLVQRETQPQLREINELASKLCEISGDTPQRRKLLLRIIVLATYVKRRRDMTISADRSRVLPVGRLGGALQESCSSLSLGGIPGNLYLPETEAVIPIETAFAACDIFEAAVELALDTLTYFFVTIADEGGALYLRINMECAADFSAIAQRYPEAAFEQDEGGWFITERLTGGGGSI